MNVTLVVITILVRTTISNNLAILSHRTCREQEQPYVMMHYGKNYTGNARFYGFCVDVLDRVAKETGFDYLLDLVPDRKYGAKDPISGEWNGMVAELIKHVSKQGPTYHHLL